MNAKGKIPRTAECKARWRLLSLLMLAAFVLSSDLVGQRRSATATGLSAKGESSGSLRVIVTVQSSVGIVMNKDGQPQVIVANAPDVRDGVVYLKEDGPRGASSAPQSAKRQNPSSANTDSLSPAQKAKANQVREANRND